jgi:hypothetical protein
MRCVAGPVTKSHYLKPNQEVPPLTTWRPVSTALLGHPPAQSPHLNPTGGDHEHCRILARKPASQKAQICPKPQ